MISEIGQEFLQQVLTVKDIKLVIESYAYSERVTIAFDLQLLIKHLLRELELLTGESLVDALLGVKDSNKQ